MRGGAPQAPVGGEVTIDLPTRPHDPTRPLCSSKLLVVTTLELPLLPETAVKASSSIIVANRLHLAYRSESAPAR